MRVAIFSDIHGNLPAFEIMLKDAGKVDLYVSLGDVVDFGPWSNECVDLLESLDNCIKILGNHEEFFISGKYEGEKQIVKSFFDFCILDFTNFVPLKSYIKSYILGKYTFSHTLDDLYIYPDSKINLSKNYIIGHSHYQFIIKSNGFALINPGSVGQNREFIDVINYLILDVEKDEIENKKIPYNVDLVIDQMKKMKYPKECIEYYNKKKRFKNEYH